MNSPYHVAKIKKGVLGEFSKVEEEIQELLDAKAQDNHLLMLCEIADLLGAINSYTKSRYSLGLKEIYKMTQLNEKAFKTGYRV